MASKVKSKEKPKNQAVEEDAAGGDDISHVATFLVLVGRITGRLQSGAALKDLGITMPDWLLLRVVKDTPAISMASAARRIGVSRQRVHQQATKLEAAGFLALSKGEDEKARELTLSPAGDSLVARSDKALMDVLAPDGKIPSKEIQSARRSAGKIARLLAQKKADEEAEAG